MKTSVALCTYNGADFIKEQLESILNQTLSVDEIIISDDGSTDKTIGILNDYKKRNPSKIRVFINKSKLGYIKNFEKAICSTTGDIIFLSDQDDVWREDKVEKIVSIFREHPDINYVFSDGIMIDERGQQLGKTLWKAVGFSKVKQALFNGKTQYKIIARKPIVTGATLALRSSYVKKCIPFSSFIPHDWWITLVMSLTHPGCGFAYKQPLIFYRIHKKQSIGVGKKLHKGQIKYQTKNSIAINYFNMFRDILDSNIIKDMSRSEKTFVETAKNFFESEIEVSNLRFIKRAVFLAMNLHRAQKFRGILRTIKDLFWQQ